MQKNNALTPLEAVNKIRDDNHGRVVLVLQGGGARLLPIRAVSIRPCTKRVLSQIWIIGTSIGAINAGIIAGNKPEDRLSRLQQFVAPHRA